MGESNQSVGYAECEKRFIDMAELVCKVDRQAYEWLADKLASGEC